MDEKFINQREKALENYFSTTLKVLNVSNSPSLRDFLFKGKNSNDTPVIQDEPIGNSQINSVITLNPNNNKTNDTSQNLQQ